MQAERIFGADDTIVAPATPTGGAICIIRLSGPRAIELCDGIFDGRGSLTDAATATVHYGNIVDGDEAIDDVLVAVFRAPHSYTGEDSAEISAHGSSYVVGRILSLLVSHGARPAEAGEFTRRAFMNGRMDLSQAEAVADTIAAESRAAHALASSQMRGAYAEKLGSLREGLLRLVSLLELELDFSEEDVEFADRPTLRNQMERIEQEITRLNESFTLGNALKEGVAVAIVGRPNVGKSTLMNRLVGDQRAMVSEIAGTTRDTIEECVNIDGVLFRFIDTAGLHQTEDRLEQMGIERTRQAIGRARVLLHLLDASSPNDPETAPDLLSAASSPRQYRLTVVNKTDSAAPGFRIPQDAIGISAKNGTGIDELLRRLRRTVDTTGLYTGDAIVSNSRHAEALRLSGDALRRALQALDAGLPTDLLCEELRQVLHHLGTITGQITSDDILANIFSKFCIGK